VFEPILLEKVWGGRRLERYGKKLPPGKLIGESWEVADLPATSESGAGGGPARSVIANGALAGRTLHDALELWGEGLLGPKPPWPGGAYPLLVKFLDARENLSVQVHPSPAYAAAHPGAHLKTECWYVLQAGIAEPHEIPAECGVMLAGADGLEVARAAPKRAMRLSFGVWMVLARATPVPGWRFEDDQGWLGEGASA
jgi:hypothetical protein